MSKKSFLLFKRGGTEKYAALTFEVIDDKISNRLQEICGDISKKYNIMLEEWKDRSCSDSVTVGPIKEYLF